MSERRRTLSALATLKIVYADKQTPRLRDLVKRSLDGCVRSFASQVGQGGGPQLLAGFKTRWVAELDAAIRAPLAFMAAHGFELAGDEIHGTAHAGKSFVPFGAKAKIAGVDVGEKDDGKFVQKSNWSAVDKFIRTTAESATATTGERLGNIFKRASENADGRTPLQIEKQILAEGITQNEARAHMLAITGAIWSYGEGAVQRYKDDGVAVMEWLTAEDDLLCEFCMAMHGRRIRPGDPFFEAGSTLSLPTGTLKIPGGVRGFDVTHPPLHPHCRCTLIPIVDARQIPEEAPKIQAPAPQPKPTPVLKRPPAKKPKPAPVPVPAPIPAPKPPQAAPPPPLIEAPTRKPVSMAKPAEPVAPKTTTAAATMKVTAKGAVGNAAREAAAAMDSVHILPLGTPEIPVSKMSKLATWGEYFHSGKIKISDKGRTPQLTTAHEMGHFLDHKVLHTPGSFGSISGSPDFADLDAALQKSDAVISLNAALAKPGSNKKYLTYATSQKEVFARSYAQWIAVESKSPVMAEELTRSRVGTYQTQWAEEDFKPIAAEFRKLFKLKGLIP